MYVFNAELLFTLFVNGFRPGARLGFLLYFYLRKPDFKVKNILSCVARCPNGARPVLDAVGLSIVRNIGYTVLLSL